jgi:Fur family iron response transcriptional regulator
MKSEIITPKKSCLTTSEIEGLLLKAGVNPTAQRLAICKYVLCEADHPTAEQVKEWADRNFPKLSLATVYNTLKTLVEAGLLKELKFPHLDKSIYDNHVHNHYHFLEETTGELIDLDPQDIKVSHQLKETFQVNEINLLIRGKRISNNQRK